MLYNQMQTNYLIMLSFLYLHLFINNIIILITAYQITKNLLPLIIHQGDYIFLLSSHSFTDTLYINIIHTLIDPHH